MASLPHFSLPFSAYSSLDPVYNLCEVDLGTQEFSEIEHSITKVEKNSIYFNMNVDSDGYIEVLDFVRQSLKSKEVFDIGEFKFLNKSGDVIYRIVIENFRFTKIVNLLDFDYSDDVKQLQVKFKYDIYELVYEKDYKKYIRRLKLKSIGESLL